MADPNEPTDWLFDGANPARDLPASEADRVTELSLTYDDPVCTSLPDSAVDGIRELFRGFFAHTPYRRLGTIERVDDATIAVHAESRTSATEPGGWEPHVHDRDVESMQAQLIEYFGPLWRIRRRRGADEGEPVDGVLEVRRVVGRRFHYPGAEGDRQ
jgi:hypothetical protein